MSWWEKPSTGNTLGVTDIIKFKMKTWLDDATSDEYLQNVLSVRAFQHSTFVHNNTPNEDGKTPNFLFYGKPSPSLQKLPVFGTDTTVKIKSKNSQGRSRVELVKGVYLGVDKDEHTIYEIWTNFKNPCEKMETIKGRTLVSSGGFTCMQAAETEVRKIIRSGVSPMDLAKANCGTAESGEDEEEEEEIPTTSGSDMLEWLYNKFKGQVPDLPKPPSMVDREEEQASAQEQGGASVTQEDLSASEDEDEGKKLTDEESFQALLEKQFSVFRVRVADENWGKLPPIEARCKAARPIVAQELREWRRKLAYQPNLEELDTSSIRSATITCMELSQKLVESLDDQSTPLHDLLTSLTMFESVLQDVAQPKSRNKPFYGPEVLGSIKSFSGSVRIFISLLEEHGPQAIDPKPSHDTKNDSSGTSSGKNFTGSESANSKSSSSKEKKSTSSPKSDSAETLVSRYSKHVQDAFEECLNIHSDPSVSKTEPAKSVALLAEQVIQELFHLVPSEQSSWTLFQGVLDDLVVSLDPVNLMLFVAASHKSTLKKYFPKQEQLFSHLNRESQRIAREILKAYTTLETHWELDNDMKTDLGFVFGALCKFVNQKVSNGWDDLRDEESVLKLMIMQWKGSSYKALEFLILSVEDFEWRYPEGEYLVEPSQYLLQVIRGFPPEAKREIDDWYGTVYGVLPGLSKRTMARDFLTSVWPTLPSNSRIRARSDCRVPTRLFDKFYAKIRVGNCADGFWDIQKVDPVPTASSTNEQENQSKQETSSVVSDKAKAPEENNHSPAPEQKSAKAPKDEPAVKEPTDSIVGSNPTAKDTKGKAISKASGASSADSSIKKVPTAEEKFAAKMRDLLTKHPELCPNCLEKHKLSECPNIEPDSRDNPAAYIVADYEKQTNKSRLPFLQKCSERVNGAYKSELEKTTRKAKKPKIAKTHKSGKSAAKGNVGS